MATPRAEGEGDAVNGGLIAVSPAAEPRRPGRLSAARVRFLTWPGAPKGESTLAYQVVDQSSSPAVRMPPALDLVGPNRQLTSAAVSRKVKVLFIVSAPISSPSVSVHVNLMKFFDRDRVEVHVLYNRLADGEPYQSAGTSVLEVLPHSPDIHLFPATFGPLGGTPRKELLVSGARSVVPAIRDAVSLVRHIRRHGIDIIHCEYGYRNGLYGYALSRITQAKYVIQFHWVYGSWLRPLSRFAIQHADGIIAVSRWAGSVLEQAGIPEGRIFPVLNGIDAAAWDPEAVDGAGIRREFGVRADAPLVVIVAQLLPPKRHATLIEAFCEVAARHPDARLLIVGKEWNPPKCPDEISFAETLRRLVAELDLERNVTFAGERRDIRQILAAADIFALPSVDEPFGLASAEAMAMAKPVVAVESGGTPELVEHGKAGLLGPPDDARRLASNIITLIDNPALRLKMGAYGRRRVLEHLNAKRMADEVEAVYRNVAGGGPPQPEKPASVASTRSGSVFRL
jgi:glycosyltransferase involved in cell wall biosynthesis